MLPHHPVTAQAGPMPHFGVAEKLGIGTSARYIRIWGLVSVLVGALIVLLGAALLIALRGSARTATFGTLGLVVGFPFVASGYFYVGAANALRSAAQTTEQNEIGHTMEGLAKLTMAMRIEVIVGALAVGFGLLAIILLPAS